MKKLPLYLLFAFFGAMLFASCKKDYNCVCKVGILGFVDTTFTVEIEDAKKGQAKVACKNNEESIPKGIGALLMATIGGVPDSLGGGGFGGIDLASLVSADCELD
jgi:hypothetical protein